MQRVEVVKKWTEMKFTCCQCTPRKGAEEFDRDSSASLLMEQIGSLLRY